MALERLTPAAEEWRTWGLLHLQRYQFARPFVRGLSVLDLACGNGYGSYTLAQSGTLSVTGVDLSSDAIGYASAQYHHPRLNFLCKSCYDLDPTDCRYDVIVSYETIEHLNDPRGFVKKARELLKPDGVLLLSAPNTLRYKKAPVPIENDFHISEPTYQDLHAWLEPDFVVLEEWEQSPIVFGASDEESALNRSIVGRALLFLERRIARIHPAFSSPADILHGASKDLPLRRSTEIWPLLPERAPLADVFMFVCRARS